MRVARAAAISIVVAFAAIQLIPVNHSNPSEANYPDAPPAIGRMLKRACYDCHSNQTRWPWYSFIAPASWVVSHHVAEGRQHLNFSEWDAYASDPETAAHKLDEIAEQVADGKMAPWYYRAAHRRARLSPSQRAPLISWARATSAKMKSLEGGE